MAVVLITGASSGIGAGLAAELARRGHDIGLVARRADLLAEVAATVRAAGRRAVVAPADVTDRDALFAAVRSIEAELGPIDVAVANAGMGYPTPAAKLDGLKVTAMMRLNFDAVVYTFEAVLPAMVARGGGQIVAISSIASMVGLPSSGTYSASKAAVSTLMQSFGAELRPKGVAVTTVHPGFVETPLTAKNKHPMPFIWTCDRACRVIADGIERRRVLVSFPWQLTMVLGIVRLLPASWAEAALRYAR